MTTYYKERSGGAWIYWTYAEGQKVTLSASAALRDEQRGLATIVLVK